MEWVDSLVEAKEIYCLKHIPGHRNRFWRQKGWPVLGYLDPKIQPAWSREYRPEFELDTLGEGWEIDPAIHGAEMLIAISLAYFE
jgi:hypothetical protein